GGRAKPLQRDQAVPPRRPQRFLSPAYFRGGRRHRHSPFALAATRRCHRDTVFLRRFRPLKTESRKVGWSLLLPRAEGLFAHCAALPARAHRPWRPDQTRYGPAGRESLSKNAEPTWEPPVLQRQSPLVRCVSETGG